MTDIVRILAEVILGTKEAVASWNNFAKAGVGAFKEVAAGAQQASAQANAALSRISGTLKGVGESAISLGRQIKRVGSTISVALGAPLLLLGRQAINAFKEQHDGWGSSLKLIADNQKALEAFQKALAELGKTLLPIQTTITQVLTDLINAFNKLSPATQSFAVKLGLIVVAAGPILFAIGGLVTIFGGLSTALGFLAPAFGLAIPAVVGFAEVLITIVTVIGEVGVAIAAAVGWPIIIAAALGALVVVVFTHWDEVKTIVGDAMAWVADKIRSAWEGLGDVVSIAIDLWKGAWNVFFAFLNSKWAGLGDFVKATLQALVSPITNMIALAKELWAWLTKAAAVNVPKPGGAGTHRAHGGRVQGRAGVDVIPAWLTNNEFVMRAAAVRKYGLGFMAAVNDMRFASGGLVSAPRMAFAGGGLASATATSGRDQRAVHVHIGNQEFRMLADSEVAAKLVRYSRDQQIKSTGRMPGWVR